MKRKIALAYFLLSAFACSSGTDAPTFPGGGGDGDGLGNEGGGNGGDPNNPGGGGGGGGGDGDGNADGICEEQAVRTDRVVPDMLIVLDRSGSMKDEDVNRWDPSVRGLNTITSQLDSAIRFGLMTFPGNGGGGGGRDDDDQCAAGQLDVPFALDNSQNIEGTLADMEPGGRTPTAATLDSVLALLGETQTGPDVFEAPQYVLLVTDGAPNCMGGGRGDDEDGAVDATVAAIEALAASGIRTYVLGYDTASDDELSAALDRMAVAGETGDQAHRAIDDEASLIQEFEAIAGAAVSCDFKLDEPPSNVSYVRVQLDGIQLNHGEENGWQLGSDGTTVTLRGDACQTLRGGGEHTLSVVVQCTLVVPF